MYMDFKTMQIKYLWYQKVKLLANNCKSLPADREVLTYWLPKTTALPKNSVLASQPRGQTKKAMSLLSSKTQTSTSPQPSILWYFPF